MFVWGWRGKEGSYADAERETQAIPDLLSAGQRGELQATGWEISPEKGDPHRCYRPSRA